MSASEELLPSLLESLSFLVTAISDTKSDMKVVMLLLLMLLKLPMLSLELSMDDEVSWR